MKKALASMFAIALSISMSSVAFAQADKPMDERADNQTETAKPKHHHHHHKDHKKTRRDETQ